MSLCRVARRIASMTPLQNASSDAESGRTLETKVFHSLLQSFSPWRSGGLPAGGQHNTVASLNSGERTPAGVPLFPWHGGARRVGCSATPVPTPFITSSLVTKEKHGDNT
jgi:hypothetical protein